MRSNIKSIDRQERDECIMPTLDNTPLSFCVILLFQGTFCGVKYDQTLLFLISKLLLRTKSLDILQF